MAKIIDAGGNLQEVKPELGWYQAAAEAGLSLPQYLNQMYPTDGKHGSAYHQIMASEGIVLKPNHEFGLSSTRVDMMAGAITKSSDFSSAALRILFPSAILTAVEDRLINDLNMNADAFNSMVALDDVISGDKFERPMLNLTGPQGARSTAIAQLAEPATMLHITTSSTSRTIPALALGLLISDQAKAATTLDLVSLAVSRQIAQERATRAGEYIGQFLNGDLDMGSGTLTAAGVRNYAAQFDASIVAAGVLTHKAWMNWLFKNSRKRMIDWVITDLAGALAIENRTGKPTISNDNPNSPRIDTIVSVGNPTWKSEVKVFILDDETAAAISWPAGTIVGLDSRYAIHRVASSTIAYQAVEQFVMRRAEALRFDFGEIAYRLYDDAFAQLDLTLS